MLFSGLVWFGSGGTLLLLLLHLDLDLDLHARAWRVSIGIMSKCEGPVTWFLTATT